MKHNPPRRQIRQTIRKLKTSAAVILTLCVASTGHAWSTDNVYDRVSEAIDRLQSLQSNANNTFIRAREAAISTEGLRDVLDRIQEVYQQADGPAKQLIDSYVQMLIALVEQQYEGFEAFTTIDPSSGTTPAEDFRTELESMLIEIDSAVTELISIDDRLTMDLDPDVVLRLLDILPDILLYPMHVAMSSGLDLLGSGFTDTLAQLVEDLKAAKTALAEVVSPPEIAVVAHDARLSQASAAPLSARELHYLGVGLQTFGNSAMVIGNVLTAISDGESEEGKVGIHGYIAIHAKVEPLKVISGMIAALGEGVAIVGARVETYAGNLADAADHDELVGKLDTLDGKVDLILAAMQTTAPDVFHSATSHPLASYALGTSSSGKVRVDPGERITLTAGIVTAPNATYQWRKDGLEIPGAMLPALTIDNATANDSGLYDVIVTDEGGTTTSAAAILSLVPGRVMNMSVRFDIPENGTLIAGFVLDGTKQVVVRGIGQTLAEFGIPIETTMADPTITIFDSAGIAVISNDDYEPSEEGDAAMDSVGAFPIVAQTDAAIVTQLSAGSYTIHVKDDQGLGGDCIVEVYDAEVE